MRCLGLDIGSSSIKGAVLDLESGSVEQITREPFPDAIAGLPSLFHEVSPEEIFQRALAVITRLSAGAPDADSLMCCGQMGGIMLVDQGFQPLTNYLSWRDQRTTQTVGGHSTLDLLQSRWSESTFQELGSELKPGSATSLLFWLSLQRQLSDKAMPITVGDYVISRLCRAAPQMDRTQTIGMLNLRTGNWHHQAFSQIDLGELRWPQLASSHEPIGTASLNGRPMKCFPVVGDQQCALRGIDLQPSELSINVSTGSQVSQITSTFQPAQCQTRCWFGGQYLNTITHIPAGRSLTVLEALLTELPRLAGLRIENSWKLIAEQADRASGDGLRCDLSFFASAMGCDGRIEGINTENLTIGNLFHAAFEFMANSYVTCSRRISAVPTWNQVAISGGLVQSFASLRQKLHDLFPMPFREVAEQEETMLGLLKIARDTLQQCGTR